MFWCPPVTAPRKPPYYEVGEKLGGYHSPLSGTWPVKKTEIKQVTTTVGYAMTEAEAKAMVAALNGDAK